MRKISCFLLLALFPSFLKAQTPVFPSGVVGVNQLTLATNNVQTSLTTAINNSATSFMVSSALGIQQYMLLSIDQEVVYVCSVSGNSITVGKTACPNVNGRGFDNTTAAAHSSGAVVSGFIDAWHHNAEVQEIIAIETALGANLSNIPGGGTQAAHSIYAGPTSGSPASPTFRGLQGADMPAVSVLTNQGNTYTSGVQSFASSNLTLPAASSFTTSSSNTIGIDSTSSNLHAWNGNADGIVGIFSSAPTTGHCVQTSVSGGKVLLSDAGSACGSGGGGSPGGSSGNLQFNNAGSSFGGVSWTAYAASPQSLTIGPAANLPNGQAGAINQVIQAGNNYRFTSLEPNNGSPATSFLFGSNQAGLFNASDQANFAGTFIGSNFLGAGRNRIDNADKTTEINLNLQANLSMSGQKFGIQNVNRCGAIGDCFAISDNLYYGSDYVTAFGDEGIKEWSAQLIEDWTRFYPITTGAGVKSSCNTTFVNNTAKSSGSSPVTFQVASTTGCVGDNTAGAGNGDWVTATIAPIQTGGATNEEVFQITGVGAGPCPGVNCTLTGILVSPHTAGDAIKFALGLPIPTQQSWQGHIGGGQIVIDKSIAPVFNLVTYNFGLSNTITATSGTSWGTAGGGGPLSGGTTALPGFIAIAQDGVKIFNSPSVTITAATNTNPAVLTAPGHGLATGTTWLVQLGGATGGWASAINSQNYFVTATDSSHLTVNQLDSTSFGSLAGSPVFYTDVLTSYVPIQSIGSSTALTTSWGYIHEATNATGTGVRAAIFGGGRIYLAVPTYNPTANPPGESTSQVELEYSNFSIANGDTLEFTVAPNNTTAGLVQLAWLPVGPHGATPCFLCEINLGSQAASAAMIVQQAGDTAPFYSFKNGIIMNQNVVNSYLSIGGYNLGVPDAVVLATKAGSNYGGGNGDGKWVHWNSSVGDPAAGGVIGMGMSAANGLVAGDLVLGSGTKEFVFADQNPIGAMKLNYANVTGGTTFSFPTKSSGSFTLCTTADCPSATYIARTIPNASPTNEVDIGSFANPGYVGVFRLGICVYDTTTTNQPCANYSFAMPNTNLNYGWFIVPPLNYTNTRLGSDIDWALEVEDVSNVLYLRLRNTGFVTHSGNASINFIMEGNTSPYTNFTPSTATATVTAPTAYLANASIEQVGGHVAYVNTAPSISGCGTGAALDTQATDIAGTISLGTSAGSCVVTFANAYTTRPHCSVNLENGGTAPFTPATGSLTISASGLTGNVDYACYQ